MNSLPSKPPTGSAPDVAAPAAPPQAIAYQGPCGHGVVGLTLPRDSDAHGAPTGAEQVLRLAEAEPLIRAVEHWLRGAWDPAPLADGAAHPPTAYGATVRDPALAPPGTRLLVPLEALWAEPPPALAAPALAWDAQSATVALGDVPADALAPLQPGSLLWLPASLAKAWEVSLIDPRRRLPPCAALLDLAMQRITLAEAGWAAAQPGAAPARQAAHAVLSRPVHLPLDRWLGWSAAGSPVVWPAPPPWQAELREGDAVLAQGALLPLGDGCGLRVDVVSQPALAA